MAHLLTDIPSLNLMGTDKFVLPPVQNPGKFFKEAFQRQDAPAPIEMAHGTTTLGFVYKNGVVIAVDSRSTMGSYIASQSVKKVIEINPYLLGTMAGGAADCTFWERELGRQCRLYELRNKERISVAAASKLLSNIVYQYKDYGLSMGTMIAGWDKTGPNLFFMSIAMERDSRGNDSQLVLDLPMRTVFWTLECDGICHPKKPQNLDEDQFIMQPIEMRTQEELSMFITSKEMDGLRFQQTIASLCMTVIKAKRKRRTEAFWTFRGTNIEDKNLE